MKINELTGYRKHPLYNILINSTSIVEFVENLRREGYRKYLIGEGLYSGVFARPEDNYVIKIFQEDPGYEKYLTYMSNNQTNPHVPKIKGKPVKFLKYYKIVRLEKLDAAERGHKDLIHRIQDYVLDHNNTASYAYLNREWISNNYPQLPEILDSIVQNKHMLDLHTGNIMFRGNVPVITDPYASPGSRAKPKSKTQYVSARTVQSSADVAQKPAVAQSSSTWIK